MSFFSNDSAMNAAWAGSKGKEGRPWSVSLRARIGGQDHQHRGHKPRDCPQSRRPPICWKIIR